METISNGIIEIGVKAHGAEMASLRCGGRQYLWQADKAFWNRYSPVLFPIVGRVWAGEYRVDGRAYKMGQHGFARDMDFELVSRSDLSLLYRLASSPATREKYPYDFALEIGYQLIDRRVRVSWTVTNTGASTLPFQIGAHPAFYWPMLTDAEIEGGIEAMAPKLAATDRRGYFKIEAKRNPLPMSLIKEGGGFGPDTTPVQLDGDACLPITVSSFDNNALVFEDSLVTKVAICGEDKKPYVELEFTSPVVGLWSLAGTRAPFVCIEPWYGRADSVGFAGDITERKWMQLLAPAQQFRAHYDIIICQPAPLSP